MNPALRRAALALIWRHTHADFKGIAGGERWPEESRGKRTILINRNGTTLTLLDDLTEAEVLDKLKYALRAEERRLDALHAQACATPGAEGRALSTRWRNGFDTLRALQLITATPGAQA